MESRVAGNRMVKQYRNEKRRPRVPRNRKPLHRQLNACQWLLESAVEARNGAAKMGVVDNEGALDRMQSWRRISAVGQ